MTSAEAYERHQANVTSPPVVGAHDIVDYVETYRWERTR